MLAGLRREAITAGIAVEWRAVERRAGSAVAAFVADEKEAVQERGSGRIAKAVGAIERIEAGTHLGDIEAVIAIAVGGTFRLAGELGAGGGVSDDDAGGIAGIELAAGAIPGGVQLGIAASRGADGGGRLPPLLGSSGLGCWHTRQGQGQGNG